MSPGAPSFRLDWHRGSSAVVDLEAKADKGLKTYKLRYSSPFRSTMRAPSQETAASPHEFDQFGEQLDDLVSRMAAAARGDKGAAKEPEETQDLINVGRDLFEGLFPPFAQAELNRRDLFVEIGTDEALLHYPWELMHDGDNFICLKHFVGRFVNVGHMPELNVLPYGAGSDLGELKALVISVPRPKTRGDGPPYPALTAAEAEANGIVNTFTNLGVQLTYLGPGKATRQTVTDALRKGEYHIIHFAGHAVFNAQDARRSALVLEDQDLTVGYLTATLRTRKAILCVINGCETVQGTGAANQGSPGQRAGSWDHEYNIYGLARPFLQTGAYLLGSRWKLGDESAQSFAEEFYSALLGEGAPIGRAITKARAAVKEVASAGDYSWASYVYYGDPRLCFTKVAVEPAEGAALDEPLAFLAPEPKVDLARLEALGQEYENTRQEMGSGWARTKLLEQIMKKIVAIGAHGAAAVLPSLVGGGEGKRVAALALLEARPDPAYFDFVVDAIGTPCSNFEQYHSLRAASLMIGDLGQEQKAKLWSALVDQQSNQEFFGTDRQLVAENLLRSLGDVGSEDAVMVPT
jgi:CHAT domain-containing protein